MKDYRNSYKKAFNLGCCFGSIEQEQGRKELQELVDKSTPMKIKQFGKDSNDPDVIVFNMLKGFCPKCLENGKRVIVGLTDNYCLCCGHRLEEI